MNKKKLDKLFTKIMDETGMDYAITDTDKYGDCNSCVNDSLIMDFGLESTGIFAKHWLKGMNKGCPWEELDELYIAHDITREQAEKMISICKESGYRILPEEYNTVITFKISEIPEKKPRATKKKSKVVKS